MCIGSWRHSSFCDVCAARAGVFGVRVVVFCTELSDVIVHREAASALVVIPFKIDARHFSPYMRWC